MGRVRSKAAAQAAHAKRRFAEREGLWVSDRDLAEIVRLIQAGEGTLVRRQSLRVTVVDVPYEGKVRRVVYDRERKTIVTVLPAAPAADGQDEASGQAG